MEVIRYGYTRKPYTIKDLVTGGKETKVTVSEVIDLKVHEYEEFIKDFFDNQYWLKDVDGEILVRCEDGRKLVVDTQGYEYARYVAHVV